VSGLRTIEHAPSTFIEVGTVQAVVKQPVDLDGDLRKFGKLIERRYLEATQHMENFVADARRQVFRSKEH